MHDLSAWFTRNPVAANLLMILVLVAGVFTATSIRIEGFPALPPSIVAIDTVYPGADAEQVDRSITRKIETALEGMPGLKRLYSQSYEGYSRVLAEKKSKFDLDRFQNEIKTRLDTIYNFPGQAEKPVVARQEFSVEALLVQVYGAADQATLQAAGRQVKEALLEDPAIAKITTFGLRPQEIRLQVSEARLTALGLAMADVAQAVNRYSFDHTSGTLKSESGRIVIRSDTRAFHQRDFQTIPILTTAQGELITLGDVAQISDSFKEVASLARFQGSPCVGMLIATTRQGDLIDVSRAARKVMDRITPTLPKEVRTSIWGEASIYMQARLSLLRDNAFQGLCIVFFMLALFLNLRLAFWVAMGIPISLGGAMIIMGPAVLDYSLNDVTTFGLIIVLGILVDDAVVVGESVFDERQKTPDPVAGTIAGVSRVSTATIFGCFTTVAAFFPSLLIDNELGKIFASFSVVVIISLLASLAESKLVLPAHLAAISLSPPRSRAWPARAWARLQNLAQSGLEKLKSRIYTPLLEMALIHRYSALTLCILAGILGVGMVFKGEIRTVFYPDVPGQIITVDMEMINGAPLDLTLENLRRLEEAAWEVNDEAGQEARNAGPPIVHLLTALNDKKNVQIWAELQPEKDRQMETLETLKQWREKVQDLEGVKKLKFTGSFETAEGFELLASMKNADLLAEATDELMTALTKIPGVHGICSDLSQGSPMLRLTLKPEARHLGITQADLAEFAGNAFGGLEIQRFSREGNEVIVYVKYREEDRQHISDLLAARLRIPSGQWVPLPMIARIEKGVTPSGILRKNRARTATIEADLDKDRITPAELMERLNKTIIPDLTTRYPGLLISESGELEEMGEMKAGLIKALVVVVLGIYALIAIPLKSYVQPVIIMSVIPFAFVGAVFGHLITGHPLSILSFLGMLGAAGVVVNDSLVMLTCYNDAVKEGIKPRLARILAGTRRFRAIFLTTVTTAGGLMPLIFETSEQARYLIPAAVSLAFGELFATPVTLILIPVLLGIGQDITAWFRKWWPTRPGNPEPADQGFL